MKNFLVSSLNAHLRYQDFPGKGRPIIFIHGLGCASSYEYPRVIISSVFRQRRIILVDLLGAGYSDRPNEFSYSTSDHARIITLLVGALGLSECDLYGHSMGGSIAIEVASMLPQIVKTLVVSEPNFDSGGGFYSRLLAEQPEDEFIRTGYSRVLAKETTPWLGCVTAMAPYALHRGACSLVEGIEPSWRELIYSLSMARWMIFGEHSLPDIDQQELPKHGIKVLAVPNAGHSMSWENPEGLADALSCAFGLSN